MLDSRRIAAPQEKLPEQRFFDPGRLGPASQFHHRLADTAEHQPNLEVWLVDPSQEGGGEGAVAITAVGGDSAGRRGESDQHAGRVAYPRKPPVGHRPAGVALGSRDLTDE